MPVGSFHCFRKFGENKIEFQMTPKEKVINPVFIVNSWTSSSARVSLDGKELDQRKFRTQIDGKDLVIWIDQVIDQPTQIIIRA
ncbi:hypothetical protein CEE34_02240 [Candidatus Aerophobetes bacterium Ae_b3a]|nr:MAG: hypothetical protein CEE34_02240 [Candidatus Aerophobetes bacterium Ae_b3a]